MRAIHYADPLCCCFGAGNPYVTGNAETLLPAVLYLKNQRQVLALSFGIEGETVELKSHRAPVSHVVGLRIVRYLLDDANANLLVRTHHDTDEKHRQ